VDHEIKKRNAIMHVDQGLVRVVFYQDGGLDDVLKILKR
jgi:hypothetical protein